MAEVQVAVRLRRKARADLGRVEGAAAWSATVPGWPAQRRCACLPAARSASTMFLMKLAAGAGAVAWLSLDIGVSGREGHP